VTCKQNWFVTLNCCTAWFAVPASAAQWFTYAWHHCSR